MPVDGSRAFLPGTEAIACAGEKLPPAGRVAAQTSLVAAWRRQATIASPPLSTATVTLLASAARCASVTVKLPPAGRVAISTTRSAPTVRTHAATTLPFASAPAATEATPSVAGVSPAGDSHVGAADALGASARQQAMAASAAAVRRGP